MTTDDLQLIEAMELWKQSYHLHPVTTIYKIIDIEYERTRLDLLHQRILMSKWSDTVVTDKECQDFVTGVLRWRGLVITEILTNGNAS